MHVGTQVHMRDELGRFIKEVEGAATKAVERSLQVGESAAKARAPIRTGRLRNSFFPAVLSRTSGVLTNTAPYARWQDEGAGRHPLPANVSFFWEREGRMWMPPEVYLRVTGYPGADPIDHPGNPATHFMDAGYRAMIARMQSILDSSYPS